MHLTLTLAHNGQPLNLFLSGNFAVHHYMDTKDGCIQDGVHNNGGWHVKETPEEILEQIKQFFGRPSNVLPSPDQAVQ